MITHLHRADARDHVTARTRAHRAAVFGMLVCALATGCSTTNVFQPGAALVPHDTSVSSPSATPANASGTGSTTAPTVANPLDLSHVVATPCDALTPSQLDHVDHRFAGATGTATNTAVAGSCGWITPDFEQMIVLAFYTNSSNGLGLLYGQRASMAYWQPMAIEDYPAVEASVTDERPHGECDVSVGTSDSRYFSVTATIDDVDQQSRACALATQVAGDVVDTLRGRR